MSTIYDIRQELGKIPNQQGKLYVNIGDTSYILLDKVVNNNNVYSVECIEASLVENKKDENDDTIFLLSLEEYTKYKSVIPTIRTNWWLRTAAGFYDYTMYVSSGGSVDEYGDCIVNIDYAVRPALRLDSHMEIGKRFVQYGYTWICIDHNLAISEMPIGFEKFCDESNEYNSSYIRQWLLDWIEERMA